MKRIKMFEDFSNNLENLEDQMQNEGLFSKKDKIKDECFAYLNDNYYVVLDTYRTGSEIVNRTYKNGKMVIKSKNTDDVCSTKEIIVDLVEQTHISDDLAYEYITKWQTSKVKLHKGQLRLKDDQFTL